MSADQSDEGQTCSYCHTAVHAGKGSYIYVHGGKQAVHFFLQMDLCT